LITAAKIDSRWEVMSDQLVRKCCTDRLSWHRFSGLIFVQPCFSAAPESYPWKSDRAPAD
jgi:hypothetical protein